MSACASNSTDCLLTELVDQGGAFNWDPINFAFTAVLSVLAVLVASLALLQGLLAAGPGRLKASKSSVGPLYGDTARNRFDWTELPFRTTVQVPFVDIPQIIESSGCDKDKIPLQSEQSAFEKYRKRSCFHVPFWWRSRQSLAQQRLGETTDKHRPWSKLGSLRAWMGRSSFRRSDIEAASVPRIPDNTEVLANWWMLLLDVGLQSLRLRTRLCKTDHLPVDVAAAPAFATIDSLMILALLAGCDSYDVHRQLPIAKGTHVQLIFRQHPNLGTVASYQSYKERSNPTHIPLDWARWGCLEALGHLYYGENSLLEVSSRSTGRFTMRSDIWGLSTAIQEHYHCEHDTCRGRNQAIGSWGRFFMQYNTRVQAVILALLFADEPRANVLFPLKLLQLHSYLQFIVRGRLEWKGNSLRIVDILKYCVKDEKSLLLFRAEESDRLFSLDLQHSKFKAHNINTDVSQTSSTTLLKENIAGSSRASWLGSAVPVAEGPLRVFPLHPNQVLRSEPERRVQTLFAANGDLLVSADVLDICFDWLDHDEFIHNMPKREKAVARKWISWQLATIDSWLKVHGGNDALCAALNVLVKLHTSTRHALRVRDIPRHPRLAILCEGSTTQPWTSSDTIHLNGNTPVVDNDQAVHGLIAHTGGNKNSRIADVPCLEYQSLVNTVPGVVDSQPLAIEGPDIRGVEEPSTALIDTNEGRNHQIRAPLRRRIFCHQELRPTHSALYRMSTNIQARSRIRVQTLSPRQGICTRRSPIPLPTARQAILGD